MQYVNDDMDDVFKKAGEDYPLHTGMPDWDKVQYALNEQAAQQPVQQKKRNRHLWLLLLLLPFTFICTRYINSKNTFTGNEPDVVEKSAEEKVQKNKVLQKAETAIDKHKTSDLESETIAPANEKWTVTEDVVAGNVFSRNNLINTAEENQQLIKTKVQRSSAQQSKLQLYENSNSFYKQKEAPPDAVENIAPQKAELLLLNAGKTLITLHATSPLAAVSSALAANPALHPKAGASAASKSALHHKKGFYAGVAGSADITSVRLQKPSGLGWHYGLLAGYQFAKRWSIESGLFTNRKYYYTKGKYFDAAHLYLPPNTDVSEVSGACIMLEIPLAVKYDLSVGGKSAWFVTTGISSYIMKEEAYTYTYHYRSSGNYSVHNKTYNNASTNMFSVLQLSGGYSRQLGRSTALRLEPYLKLPLTGLGYGKLHFSSAGLNAGVIKKF